MRVLVATTVIATGPAGAGLRPGSGRALDGELVRPPAPPCGDATCTCARDWTGLVSGRACTLVVVAERAIEREGLVAAFADALRDLGRLDPDEPDDAAWVADLVDQHLELARAHPVSTVLDLADLAEVGELDLLRAS